MLVLVGFSIGAKAAEPAILLAKPRLKQGQQLSEYVQFYLNPTPVKKDSKVHQLYVHMGQSQLSDRVSITLVDDGGVIFSTSDLMTGNYKNLGMAIVLIELDRELSENHSSVKLKSVNAKSRVMMGSRSR